MALLVLKQESDQQFVQLTFIEGSVHFVQRVLDSAIIDGRNTLRDAAKVLFDVRYLKKIAPWAIGRAIKMDLSELWRYPSIHS